jgi:hypothetical protein
MLFLSFFYPATISSSLAAHHKRMEYSTAMQFLHVHQSSHTSRKDIGTCVGRATWEKGSATYASFRYHPPNTHRKNSAWSPHKE